MKILLIDIETSPNTAHVWGLWQQNVSLNQLLESSYTMCYSAKFLGEKTIYFDSVHKNDAKTMLEGVYKLLEQADAVVHYNGSKFDMPTLNKEFLLHKMPPTPPIKQIDLLMVVKSQFRFPSNKLDYVGKTLGVGAKTEHEGFDLWIKCMNRDGKAWKRMEEYNKQDVILLEKVYHRMLPWIKNHPNHGLYRDSSLNCCDRPVCPNCGSFNVVKKGTETTKTMKYERFKCTSCGTPIRGKNTILSREQSKVVLTQSKL